MQSPVVRVFCFDNLPNFAAFRSTIMEACMEQSIKGKWQTAWASKNFRNKLLAGILLLFITLATFPFFFQTIEERNGKVLNDWLLNQLPAFNMSVPIFVIIWFSTLFVFIRCFQSP